MHDMLRGLLTRAPKPLHHLVEKMLVTPIDVRFADGMMPDPLDPDPPKQTTRQVLWVRLRDPFSTTHGLRLDECCAAYLSDQPLLMTALRPHGIQFPSPKLGAVATLDHSMWFHKPFRIAAGKREPWSSAGAALLKAHRSSPCG